MGFLISKIENDFINYADICFLEFGDRVKNWVTLNEPYALAYNGYVLGNYAPGRGDKNQDGDPQVEPYIVAYNLLNCHAAADRKYQEDYKPFQKGKLGITINCCYFQPYRGSSHQPDIQAVDYAYNFMFGWSMEPLAKGTWPESMQKFAITPTSEYPNGRVLPKFSIDQHKNLIASYDFLGINYCTANYVQYQDPSDEIPSGYVADCHYESWQDKTQKDMILESLRFEARLCPEQFAELLVLIKRNYNITKDIIITENGSPDKNHPGKTCEEVCNDTYRINYIKQHLKAIRVARRNKVNVTGYFVWSFVGSFEWSLGYTLLTLRFGMIYVDYMKDLQRYLKRSAVWFRKFLLDQDKKVSFKRNIMTQSEQENQVNETSNKTKKAIEASQKLKKSKLDKS